MSDQNTGNIENKNRTRKFWEDFEKKTSQTCEMAVSDLLFLRFQHGSDPDPVSVFYLPAPGPGKGTGGNGIYVAPDTDGTFRSALYLEPAGVQCTL